MKKMIALAALICFAAPALAGLTGFQANLSQLGSFGNGGAFTVSLRDNNPGNVVAGGAPNNPIYYGTVPWANLIFGTIGNAKTTFCVENVTFSPGTWYAASVDDSILNGGGSNPDTPTNTTRNMFAQYATGTIVATTDTGGYAGLLGQTLAQIVGTSPQWNKALQDIFWAEQGTGLSNGSPAADRNFLLANFDVASIYSNSVKILNLWQGPNPYQGDKQSHLVICVPAPAAAFLGLIGLGLAGWVKRRLS